MQLVCFECEEVVEAHDPVALGEALVGHAREKHDWPYPDQAIRNYAEATQRLTGESERLDSIGPIEIHQVTEDRLDDWRSFFDHDAFVGTPEWASCYCLEPHVREPDGDPDEETPHWRENRDAMAKRLANGGSFGYLAYVDGKVAGWVNASVRDSYTLYGNVDPDGPDPSTVIGVSCFIVAPPYRRHGVAEALLERVIADSAARRARWIEAYPFNETHGDDNKNFRGLRAMYDERGFETVEVRGRDTVVRREVPS